MSGQERHAGKFMRVGDDGEVYHCAAYGPGGHDHCFCEESGPCGSLLMCEQRMSQQRMKLWVRMLALAAAGDETAAYLLTEFTGPDDLLGGKQADPDA